MPTGEPTDPLSSGKKLIVTSISAKVHKNSGYMTDDLQTLVGKRISYLLWHGAIFESVEISPQGFVPITDVISCLNKDINVPVDSNDIKRVVFKDRKVRFSILQDSICASMGVALIYRSYPFLSMMKFWAAKSSTRQF